MATLLGLNYPVSNISFLPTKTTADHRRSDPYSYLLCGRYEILEEVSRGRYGVVYKARDTKTGRIVAVKEVFDGSSIETQREINILASLPRHPSIVEYCDFPVDDWRGVYIVMEYLETDLHRLMKSRQAFSLSEVKRLMRQLLEGVELLHESGVMHRDLKPSNILVVDQNNLQLKIGEFGLSRFFDLRRPGTVQMDPAQCGVDCSSLWYRAPELLLRAHEYSCAIDMWSVGCIMAELLLNEVLFQSDCCEFEQLAIIYDAVVGRDYLASKFIHHLSRPTFPGRVTTLCLDLITDLLTFDPQQRITATQALHHPWFNEFPSFPTAALSSSSY